MDRVTHNKAFSGYRFFSWDTLAIIVVVLYFASGLQVLLCKYAYFGYYDWDLALYANALWNLSHGSVVSSLFGTNFLTNHAEYVAFFLAPLYKIFPHPFTLIVLKLFSLSSAGLIFYFFTKHILKDGVIAFGCMLAYLFYPANIFMLIYEFHFENLALPFIFLAFYFFFVNQRFVLFVIAVTCASLVKENIALLMAFMGVYSLVFAKDRKAVWGLAPLGIGGGMFIVSIFLFIPWLREQYGLGAANQYVGLYVSAMDQHRSVLVNVGIVARDTIGRFFSIANGQYVRDLFLPFLGIPFLRGDVLLIGMPIFLQHLLSNDMKMKMIFFHYAATAAALVFIALVFALQKMGSRVRRRTYRVVLLGVLLSVFVYEWLWLASSNLRGRLQWDDADDQFRWELVRQIPPDAGVVSSFDFLSELSSRKNLYSFHVLWRGSNPFVVQTADDIYAHSSWALIDFNCGWLWQDIFQADYLKRREIAGRVRSFFNDREWSVFDAAGDLVLFRRGDIPGAMRLIEINPPGGASVDRKPLCVDGVFYFDDVRIRTERTRLGGGRRRAVIFTFSWSTKKSLNDIYSMELFFVDPNGHIVLTKRRTIGYAVYPTFLWSAGDRVREEYRIALSDLPAGEYRVGVYFYRNRNSERVPIAVTEAVDAKRESGIFIGQYSLR